jgi:hypothetical protein
LLAEDSAANRALAFASRLRAFSRSGGTVTVRGALSSAMSTSSVSPPATPAAARTSALTPTMNLPPITAIVLR